MSNTDWKTKQARRKVNEFRRDGHYNEIQRNYSPNRISDVFLEGHHYNQKPKNRNREHKESGEE